MIHMGLLAASGRRVVLEKWKLKLDMVDISFLWNITYETVINSSYIIYSKNIL